MKVFIVFEQTAEGDFLQGVYKTKEAAKIAKKELLKKNKYESYAIEEHEVEE